MKRVLRNVVWCSTIISLLFVSGCIKGGFSFPPVSFATLPQPDEYPDIGAVVLLDSGSIEFRITDKEPYKPYAVLTHHRRMKILRQQGIKYATISLLDHSHARIGQLRARTVKPDGSVTHYVPEMAHTRRLIPNQNQVFERVFTLKNVHVGDVIEYWYEVLIADLHFLPVWVMSNELPTKRAEFAIINRPGIKLDIRTGDGDYVTDQLPLRRELDNGKTRLLWVKRDLPALYPESYMPALQRLRPWIALSLQITRLAQSNVKGFRTWEDVGLWFRTFTKPSRKFDQEIAEKSANYSALELYQWIQRRAFVLPIDGLGGTNPVDARWVAAGNPSHARDVVSFFWQILRDQKIRSYPLLVVPDSQSVLLKDFPSLQPFKKVIVSMEDKFGRATYIDPTCTYCGFGQLPLSLSGAQALKITSTGVKWITLPISKPEDNRIRVEYSMNLDSTGEMRGLFTMRATGQIATEIRKQLLKAKKDRKTIVYDHLTELGSMLEIEDIQISNLKDYGAPLKITGSCNVRLRSIGYQRAEYANSLIGGTLLAEYWRESRRHRLFTGGPFLNEIVVTIRYPVDYQVDAPLPVDIPSSMGTYQTRYRVNGNLFTAVRSLRINAHSVSSQQYPDFLQFLKKARKVEDIGVVFTMAE